MAKTFAQFVAETKGLADLRASIERLGLEETRRRMITNALSILGQQLRGGITGTDYYSQQLKQLYQIFPLLLMGTQTPQEVAQITAGVGGQVQQIRSEQETAKGLIETIGAMTQNLGSLQKAVTEYAKSFPAQARGLIEQYGTTLTNLLNTYGALAVQLASRGQVQPALQITAQMPERISGAVGELAKFEMDVEGRRRLMTEQQRFQEHMAFLNAEIQRNLASYESALRRGEIQFAKELETQLQERLLEKRYTLEENLMRLQHSFDLNKMAIKQEFDKELIRLEAGERRKLQQMINETQIRIQRMEDATRIKIAEMTTERTLRALKYKLGVTANQLIDSLNEVGVEALNSALVYFNIRPEHRKFIEDALEGRGNYDIHYDKSNKQLVILQVDEKNKVKKEIYRISPKTSKPEDINMIESFMAQFVQARRRIAQIIGSGKIPKEALQMTGEEYIEMDIE